MRTFKCLFSVFVLLVTVSAPLLAHTVYVVPSGGEDTDNLQAALNECTVLYQEGCVVQLSAGNYITRQLLVHNFHGTLKGMGMDATVIEAQPDLPINDDRPFNLHDPSPTNPWPVLMMFLGDGTVNFSDFSLKVPAAAPAEDYWIDPDNMVNYLWIVVYIDGLSVNTTIDRVRLELGLMAQPPPRLYNSFAGIVYWSLGDEPVTGTLKVTSSMFSKCSLCVRAMHLKDSKVTIGGSPSTGNTFEDIGTAVASEDGENTTTEISFNTILRADFAGVITIQGQSQIASRFLIKNNTITTMWTGTENWWPDGIWTYDFGSYGSGKRSEFVVSGNSIRLGPAGGSGISASSDQGSVFSNNKISGPGFAGIWAGGSTQCMLLGNNVERFTPWDTPYGTFAPIRLDELTSDCNVVGGHNATNVMDLGTNNTLIGVNNMHGNPPGPALKEAMQRKLEILKQMAMRP